MIIYGWRYYNRRNYSYVRDQCGQCGHKGYLESFESSKFAHIYWIPVIPIGRSKMLTQCPHCNEGQLMPSRKWRKMKVKELAASVDEYLQDPSSSEKAKAALGLAAFLQDGDALRRVGEICEKKFAGDAEMLARVADAYSYLCLDAEAELNYLKAMDSSADPEISERAKFHMEASAVAKPTPPNRIIQSLPTLIVPAALLFLLTVGAQRAISPSMEHAYIVNGLNEAYTFALNGKEIELLPMQKIKASGVRFGENTIEDMPGGSEIPSARFTINSDLSSRLFAEGYAVVNPDQRAVIVSQQVRYSDVSKMNSSDSSNAKILSGSSSYRFNNVDCFFTPPPESVSLSSSRTVAYRHVVDHIDKADPIERLRYISGYGGEAGLKSYLESALKRVDCESILVTYGSQILPPERVLSLAERHLDIRPANIEWHRMYQELQITRIGAEAVEQRYRKLYEANSGDHRLAYLYGRVCQSPRESVAAFEKAAALGQPTGYAANGLAYHWLLAGNFKKALEWSDLAVERAPDSLHFEAIRVELLYTNREYLEIEAKCRSAYKSDAESLSALANLVHVLGCERKVDEA